VKPTAIVVTAFPGDPTAEERRAAIAAGERPRKDYLEVADALGDAVIVDHTYMEREAGAPARLVARVAGLPLGQVTEVFLRRRRFGHVIAWADRLGVPLGLLLRVTRARLDVILISVLLTRGAKGFLVRRLGATAPLRAILGRSLQLRLLGEEFGVPAGKLVLDEFGVDDRFFSPAGEPEGRTVCAVGWEERDHATLLRAARGLDATLELAVGTIADAEDAPTARARIAELLGEELPPNVTVGHHKPAQLRDVYTRSTCAVVAVHDVEFDAGVTATMEAMAMGRPVIASRTDGLADLFTDGVEGIFVPPGDDAALRAAIERLLGDPDEARRMGAAARSLVESRHRLDDRVARIVANVRAGQPGSAAR
jgi:glycosyltransferase involved in cell wall biosynthesis